MGVDRKMEVKAVKLGALDGVGYRSNAATDRKIESLRQRHFSLFARSSPASPPPAEDSTTTKRCIDTSPNTPETDTSYIQWYAVNCLSFTGLKTSRIVIFSDCGCDGVLTHNTKTWMTVTQSRESRVGR